ncbi:unnamed protein product, partial [Darwinula stevensoni]
MDAKGVARLSAPITTIDQLDDNCGSDDAMTAFDTENGFIDDVSLDQATSHNHKKVIFIRDALPGETVLYQTVRRKKNFAEANLIQVLKASSIRTQPPCPYFGVCGGCSMQHIDHQAQVAIKLKVLEDNLWHIGRVKAAQIMPPIVGLPIAAQIPQIEFAVGDRSLPHYIALVVRILAPLTMDDETRLKQFADNHPVQIWLQIKNPEDAQLFYPPAAKLCYTLPEFSVTMPFKPIDFTQVNHPINRVMIRKAITLLDIAPSHRVLDLFCGIGNFTLPLARKSHAVVGIEGSQSLVDRALDNAKFNQLDDHTTFFAKNLFETSAEDVAQWGAFDRWLIDPPREGAYAVAKALSILHQARFQGLPEKIVYISCNPATLARDCGELVHHAGYQLTAVSTINMFPHTSHVESIALLTRPT